MKRKHLAVLLSIALAASTTLPAMAAVNSGQNSRTERVEAFRQTSKEFRQNRNFF